LFKAVKTKKRGYVYGFRGLTKREPHERFSVMIEVKKITN